MGGEHSHSKARRGAGEPMPVRPDTAGHLRKIREDDAGQAGGLGELFARHLAAKHAEATVNEQDEAARYRAGVTAGLDWAWSPEGKIWVQGPGEMDMQEWALQAIAAQDQILGTDISEGPLASPEHQGWADALKETMWHNDKPGVLCYWQKNDELCLPAERHRLETS